MIHMDKSPATATGRPEATGRNALTLAHGGGGQLTDELVGDLILPRLGNEILNDLLDSAELNVGAAKLAITIDGYVVQPLTFPGGDIGRLCISGTVNDLAVVGATPLGIALSFILAEGLDKSLLATIVDSISATAKEAGVKVITGDTKVVGRGQADGMYVVTAGVGVRSDRRFHPDQVQAGDAILLSGTIADHGMAVMLAREMPSVRSMLKSDVAPLNGMIAALLKDVGQGVRYMRDPTRGGLSGLVADLAMRTGLHVTLDENTIPIRPETNHVAEMLGIDPLDVANEGKLVAVVRQAEAEAALQSMRAHPLGRDAVQIGTIQDVRDGLCELRTKLGGSRILQKPYGEQLPRIC